MYRTTKWRALTSREYSTDLVEPADCRPQFDEGQEVACLMNDMSP